MSSPRLFLVHCGYHDKTLEHGAFEAHVDFFVAAEDFDEAKRKAKALPVFRERKMHVDGMLCVEQVQGYRVTLVEPEGDATIVSSSKQSFTQLNRK
jgi:hypothetical protein